jgi:hypothetical protein
MSERNKCMNGLPLSPSVVGFWYYDEDERNARTEEQDSYLREATAAFL